MDSQRGELVRSIFIDALSLTGSARTRLLDERCAGDQELRRDVESLLAHDVASASFLETPPIGRSALPENLVGAVLPREHSGDRVGSFELLRVIGEGAFGTVWLAERHAPFHQLVALKIVKPGMDSHAVVSRFEQERRALALMDHPNIAKVLDGGVTSSGHPYFVMEYVDGEPITNACARLRYNTRQRMELFVSVCEAVQHAHQKGLIHRDLKPSNILVAVHDGQPTAKVIDFGVAKAIDQSRAEHTIFTQVGQIVGTPEYMSPEQADPGSIDIDTRADIYSLGVVLYELLVGLLPFDSGELRSKGYGEIQRIIREVDPPTPSRRLEAHLESRAKELSGAVAARGLDSAVGASHPHDGARGTHATLRELRRELEWIPLRAMRKDRERRYATASELAGDIQRYLRGEPLVAAPESRAYLVRKFARRHRGAIAATVVVGLAFGIAAAMTVSMRSARRAEADARARADDNEELATIVVNAFTQEMLLGGQFRQPQTTDEVFQAWMLLLRQRSFASPSREGFVRLTFARSLMHRPEFVETAIHQANLAVSAYERAGTTGVELADKYLLQAEVLNSNDQHLEEAMHAFERAATLFRAAMDEHPSDSRHLDSWSTANAGVAQTLVLRSPVLTNPSIPDRKTFAKQEKKWQTAIALLRTTVAEAERRKNTELESYATVTGLLGELLRMQGELDEASVFVTRSLALFTERFPNSENSPSTFGYAAKIAIDQGHPERARALFEQDVALQRARLSRWHPVLKTPYDNLATWHDTYGDPNDAIRIRLDHFLCALPESQFEAAASAVSMARSLMSAKRFVEAEQWYCCADENFLPQHPSHFAKRSTRAHIVRALTCQRRWSDAARVGMDYYAADPTPRLAAELSNVYKDWNANEPDAARAELQLRWQELAVDK